MKRMQKWMALLLAMALFAGIVTGCGTKSGESVIAEGTTEHVISEETPLEEDIEPDAPVGVNTSVNSDQPINVHLLRLPFVFEDDIENTKSKLAKVINDIFDLKY